MIKEHWVESILIGITALAVGIYLGYLLGTIIYSDDIKQLENEVVETYNKGYKDGENDAILDFMEDYYDVLIENAVLKERLEHQPSNEEYVKQILDDVELVVELQRHYYEENITTHSFGDWLQINYPELYARIESYY